MSAAERSSAKRKEPEPESLDSADIKTEKKARRKYLYYEICDAKSSDLKIIYQDACYLVQSSVMQLDCALLKDSANVKWKDGEMQVTPDLGDGLMMGAFLKTLHNPYEAPLLTTLHELSKSRVVELLRIADYFGHKPIENRLKGTFMAWTAIEHADVPSIASLAVFFMLRDGSAPSEIYFHLIKLLAFCFNHYVFPESGRLSRSVFDTAFGQHFRVAADVLYVMQRPKTQWTLAEFVKGN